MHEQRKPWVPLILEAAYRPKGWLGIMLGSRLYYEFTEAVLGSGEDWERIADSVAQEVRRHGAPPPTAQAAVEARPQGAMDADVAAVAHAAPKGTAVARPLQRMRDAAAGVSVSSVTTNANIHNNNSNSSTNTNNSGNTSIVLL